MRGQASDLEIQANEILKRRSQLVKLYSEKTGKNEAAIEKAIDRDTWLTAREALEFGLLDGLINSYKELNF